MKEFEKMEYEIKILKIHNSIRFQILLLWFVFINSKFEILWNIIFKYVTDNTILFVTIIIIYVLFL